MPARAAPPHPHHPTPHRRLPTPPRPIKSLKNLLPPLDSPPPPPYNTSPPRTGASPPRSLPLSLKRLNARHREILSLTLEGISQKEIALRLGMTPVGIGLIQRSPIFQEELARIREGDERRLRDQRVGRVGRARERLEDLAERAVGVHETALEDEDVRVRQASAEAILKRTLGGEKVGGTVNVLNAETIQLIQQAVREDREIPRAAVEPA